MKFNHDVIHIDFMIKLAAKTIKLSNLSNILLLFCFLVFKLTIWTAYYEAQTSSL